LRPRLFTYITIQEKQEGAVLLRDRAGFGQGLLNTKLFLKRQKHTVSSFHLKQKYYFQITWKSAESVGAIGNKWENRYCFEVLVSYVYSHA